MASVIASSTGRVESSGAPPRTGRPAVRWPVSADFWRWRDRMASWEVADGRCLGGSLRLIALVVLAPLAAAGQGTNGWTGPKTPWGDPDLHRTYTNKTITPVQRPEELAGHAFLTDEEIAALERETVERNERLLLWPALRTPVRNVDRGVHGAPTLRRHRRRLVASAA